MYNFKGADWGGRVIKNQEINKKILDVGIPRGATKKQVEQIQKAVEYAKGKGIELKINVVK